MCTCSGGPALPSCTQARAIQACGDIHRGLQAIRHVLQTIGILWDIQMMPMADITEIYVTSHHPSDCLPASHGVFSQQYRNLYHAY